MPYPKSTAFGLREMPARWAAVFLLAAGLRPLPSGALPLWTPHSCRRGLGGQGEERPLPPLTEAGVIPWASRGRVLALRAAGRTNPLTPTPFGPEITTK